MAYIGLVFLWSGHAGSRDQAIAFFEVILMVPSIPAWNTTRLI